MQLVEFTPKVNVIISHLFLSRLSQLNQGLQLYHLNPFITYILY